MAIDPRIIMSGNQLDLVGALQRGGQAGQQQRMFKEQNALNGFLQNNGQAIMSGDQNALNQLAGMGQAGLQLAQGTVDTNLGREQTRLGMDATRQGMQLAQAQESRLTQQHKLALAEHVAQQGAAAAQQERDELEGVLSGAAQFHAQGDQQGYLGWLQRNNLDPQEYPFEQFPAIAATYGDVLSVYDDAIARSAPGGGNTPTVGAQEILEDGTIVQSTSQGPRVFNRLGEVVTGQAAADAVAEANRVRVENEMAVARGRRVGQNIGEAETGAEAAAAGEIGTQGIRLGAEYFEKYRAVQSGVSAIDRAIAALDDGARAGFVANQLPNITQASGELRSAMNTLGLSVVAGTTFGALSEAELRLAMETAVPQDLGPAALRDWLVERKSAQVKAAQELANAAAFFNGGGTIDEYISEYGGSKAGGSGASDAGNDAQATPPTALTPETILSAPDADIIGMIEQAGGFGNLSDEQLRAIEAREQ